jgi:hypothetical protein
MRQSVFTERGLQDGSHVGQVALDVMAAKEHARGGIGDGEWIAALAVQRAEPTLEVHAPDIVRRDRVSEWLCERWSVAAASTRMREPVTSEYVADAAGDRPVLARGVPLQIGQDLPRAPCGVRRAYLEDLLLDGGLDRLRRMQRATGLRLECLVAHFAISAEQSISAVAADVEYVADRRERVFFVVGLHGVDELALLIGGVGCVPAHSRIEPDPRNAT